MSAGAARARRREPPLLLVARLVAALQRRDPRPRSRLPRQHGLHDLRRRASLGRPHGSERRNEELIGTDAPAGANGCPSSGFQISLGYAFYDGYPALGYESLCYQPLTGTRGQSPATPAQPPAPTTYDMLRLAQNTSASPVVWQNGSKFNGGAASGGSATEFAGGSIGRAFSTASENRFQGDIAEVIVFDSALSDDQAQQMGAYFKQHWGL